MSAPPALEPLPTVAAGGTLQSDRARRPGRRRAVVALLLLAPLVLVGSAASGTALAVERSQQEAASRLAAGDYATALALYRDLAGRSGPLYLLDRQAIRDAAGQENRTLLAWAPALARRGRVEQALGLLSQAHPAEPGGERTRLRVTLLLDGARAAAAAGDPAAALGRLDEVAAEEPPADLSRQAAALRPGYEIDSASALLRAGRPGEAVAALDRAHSLAHPAPQERQLAQLLPGALLAGARLAHQRDDHAGAVALLNRLLAEAPRSAEAREARGLLAAPQAVTGTLTRRDGTPLSGGVRLAGHFVRSDRGDYATGPYFAGVAAADGDFRVDGVPVGGPYVLQVQRNGDWLTPVDTASGDPAYPARVTPLTPVDLTFVVVPS